MKRTPMKRTAWPKRHVVLKKERNDVPATEVVVGMAYPVKARAIASLSRKPIQIDANDFHPVPKTVAYRDRTLLDMARNRPCLLGVVNICNHRVATTVSAHSNFSVHGKGAHRKADDCYSVWACSACHMWLDQGTALVGYKKAMFQLAHESQIEWWKRIAFDRSEPERFRKAAANALSALKVKK